MKGFFANLRKLSKTILATITMIVCLVIVYITSSIFVSNQAEQVCFDTLHNYTSQTVREISRKVLSDSERLESIARIISYSEDVEQNNVKQILSGFTPSGLMAELELLLPDNRLILKDGRYIDASHVLNFENEAEKGAYVSDAATNIADGGDIIRNAVPVIRNGQTVAMLYGVVRLEELPALFTVDAYDGKTQLYIIDGNTGDFLLDSWNKTLGNISSMSSRKAKKGYEFEETERNLRKGENGYVAF